MRNSYLTVGFYFLVGGFFFLACEPALPTERLHQFELSAGYHWQNDSLCIEVDNPLKSPLTIKPTSSDKQVNSLLQQHFPLILKAEQDTAWFGSFSPMVDTLQRTIELVISLGALGSSGQLDTLMWPFPKGRQYKIIQGYNGRFSHQSAYSRYALDFDLAVGDTICAAAPGWVVGVVSGYKHGGKATKWRNYGNFITLFHPDMNAYTQYVHLQHNGSLVKVGDSIILGQPIGLSGMTGQTTLPHLHFNVLTPTAEGLLSGMAVFSGGILGSSLKKGQIVRHNK